MLSLLPAWGKLVLGAFLPLWEEGMGWEGLDAARQAGWGAGEAQEEDVLWTSVTQRLMSAAVPAWEPGPRVHDAETCAF